MNYFRLFLAASTGILILAGTTHLATASSLSSFAPKGTIRFQIPFEVKTLVTDESAKPIFETSLPDRRISAFRTSQRSLQISVIPRNSLTNCFDQRDQLKPLKKIQIGNRRYCLSEITEGAAGTAYSRTSYATSYFGTKALVFQFQTETPSCGIHNESTRECGDDRLEKDRAYFEMIIRTLRVLP